jgi:peroxiredoxin
MKWLAVAVLAAAPLCAGTAVDQAAKRFDQAVAKVPGTVGAEFRDLGCKALRNAPCVADFLEKPTPPVRLAPLGAAAAITGKLRTIRGLATDADRAQVVIDIAREIRALPAGAERLTLASGLCGRVTEGDLGRDALSAAVSALADGIKGTTADAAVYVELASLVRYEHVPKPMEDPALDAALALLELRESLHQEAGFTLTSLDGKTYSLEGLRGKVVLLNFWATWCPPCRKEMPDMQKLYTELAPKGFVVLAVSDEKRDVVEKFLADKHYTFPVLLDDGRKVHESFDVDGIPKSFLFNREGKIVGQAIDMRTEQQFREMLKAAGLQ